MAPGTSSCAVVAPSSALCPKPRAMPHAITNAAIHAWCFRCMGNLPRSEAGADSRLEPETPAGASARSRPLVNSSTGGVPMQTIPDPGRLAEVDISGVDKLRRLVAAFNRSGPPARPA